MEKFAFMTAETAALVELDRPSLPGRAAQKKDRSGTNW
jgi:hypothetical protein